MKRFWVIDLEGFGMSEDTREARGPFKSIAEAEKWLKEDARESFQSFNEPQSLGGNREWAAPCLIVEERKKLKQTPVVSFEIKLEAAK